MNRLVLMTFVSSLATAALSDIAVTTKRLGEISSKSNVVIGVSATGMATETWVRGEGYTKTNAVKDIASSDSITNAGAKAWVTAQGYLTEETDPTATAKAQAAIAAAGCVTNGVNIVGNEFSISNGESNVIYNDWERERGWVFNGISVWSEFTYKAGELFSGDDKIYNEGGDWYVEGNKSGEIAIVEEIPTDYIPAAGDTNSVAAILNAARTDAQSKFKPFQSAVSQTGSASQTVTAFTQTTGGVASVTFGDISITKSQISDLPTIPTTYLKTATISADGNTFTATKQDDTTVGITVNYEYALRTAANNNIHLVSGEIVSRTIASGSLFITLPNYIENQSMDCILRVDASVATQIGSITDEDGNELSFDWLCDNLTTSGSIAANKVRYIMFTRVGATRFCISSQEVK